MPHKKRIQDAIGKYVAKNTPKTILRKNSKPEKEVEKLVLDWARKKGWSLDVVEAKATFNEKLGRYISASVKAGFVDLVGCDDNGRSVFIELKAPGKLKTLRVAQYDFLMEKINKNSFGCVVDSPALLESIYEKFINGAGKSFLLDLLNALKPSILIAEENFKLFED